MRAKRPSGRVALHEWFDRLGGLVPVHGNLHRSPIPMTSAHLRAVKSAGIRVVFSMTDMAPGELLRQHGFDWRPHFWTDNAPPTPREIDRFLEEYLAVADGEPVLVHCNAGWGRTGSAVACALVARGMPADAALRTFWKAVPAAERIMRENRQTDAVHAYAARRAGRGL